MLIVILFISQSLLHRPKWQLNVIGLCTVEVLVLFHTFFKAFAFLGIEVLLYNGLLLDLLTVKLYPDLRIRLVILKVNLLGQHSDVLL